MGCLTGCAAELEGGELTKLYAPYYEEDLETIWFTDTEKSLILDMSANTYLKTLLLETEYYEYEYDPSQSETGKANYTLILQDLELEIYAGGVVRFVYADGGEEEASMAVVLKNEFAYLESMIDGGEVAFDEYTAEQTIKVDNSVNTGLVIAEKESFLESLQELRFVKLKDKEHYQTGEVAYTVQIDDDTILVYENFASVNGALYMLSQGEFDFLKDLPFGFSSENLPWL